MKIFVFSLSTIRGVYHYYYQLKQLDGHDKDKETKDEIQEIYYEHKGNYGYRRITLELRN